MQTWAARGIKAKFEFNAAMQLVQNVKITA